MSAEISRQTPEVAAVIAFLVRNLQRTLLAISRVLLTLISAALPAVAGIPLARPLQTIASIARTTHSWFSAVRSTIIEKPLTLASDVRSSVVRMPFARRLISLAPIKSITEKITAQEETDTSESKKISIIRPIEIGKALANRLKSYASDISSSEVNKHSSEQLQSPSHKVESTNEAWFRTALSTLSAKSSNPSNPDELSQLDPSDTSKIEKPEFHKFLYSSAIEKTHNALRNMVSLTHPFKTSIASSESASSTSLDSDPSSDSSVTEKSVTTSDCPDGKMSRGRAQVSSLSNTRPSDIVKSLARQKMPDVLKTSFFKKRN